MGVKFLCSTLGASNNQVCSYRLSQTQVSLEEISHKVAFAAVKKKY